MDLGTAYAEMGLLEDALREVNLVLRREPADAVAAALKRRIELEMRKPRK